MTNSQAIILGLVQGLTEYLPVSSSAHLVLVPHFFGWEVLPNEAFIFDVLVQLGTLVGVMAYFFSSIKDVGFSVVAGVLKGRPLHDENARLGWLVVLASIPAAVIGLLFKEPLAAYFSAPVFSCYCLLITGVLLLAAEYLSRVLKSNPHKGDAFIIGCAQSFALLPGVSRSGATIAAGMACGLSRKDAARFSFLMSIPVMVGASMIASLDLVKDQALLQSLALPLLLGFIASAISGYLVIRWFMDFLSTRRLTWFAAYCFSIGALGIFYFTA